jgi:hypothetical protein
LTVWFAPIRMRLRKMRPMTCPPRWLWTVDRAAPRHTYEPTARRHVVLASPQISEFGSAALPDPGLMLLTPVVCLPM